jgi:hypothetical protein
MVTRCQGTINRNPLCCPSAQSLAARWHYFSQFNIRMKSYTLPIIIAMRRFSMFPALPSRGCYIQRGTYDEALSNIKDAIQLHLEERPALHQ